MEPSAAREIVGPGKPRAWKRLATWALLASVLVCTSGCASHNWVFGTSRWATGADVDAFSAKADRPPIIMLAPCLVFDFFFFPIAIIHDMWPTTPGHEGKN